MAISHPPCLHVWSIVKCSMGGPPEVGMALYVCFVLALFYCTWMLIWQRSQLGYPNCLARPRTLKAKTLPDYLHVNLRKDFYGFRGKTTGQNDCCTFLWWCYLASTLSLNQVSVKRRGQIVRNNLNLISLSGHEIWYSIIRLILVTGAFQAHVYFGRWSM